MILEAIINLFVTMITGVLSFVDFPDMPESIVSIFDLFNEMIADVYYIFSWFLDMSLLRVFLPTVLVCANLSRLYTFTMWIIKKLPFSIE